MMNRIDLDDDIEPAVYGTIGRISLLWRKRKNNDQVMI